MKRWNAFYAMIALLVLWQGLALVVRLQILPGPLEVLRTLWKVTLSGELLVHFGVSLWRVVASMLLSVVLAAPAGLVLGQSARWNKIVSPFIYLLYPIPKVVLVPVVLLFLGIGDAAKIAIIFLILFFQILVLVRDAAAGLRTD
jgi:ABC-type nitrate/sulfonate/bicarbonate transport system permease component